MRQYQKVRFTKGNEHTAGIVVPSDVLERMTISEVSALFPYSESMKMHKLEISNKYNDWEACFRHAFE